MKKVKQNKTAFFFCALIFLYFLVFIRTGVFAFTGPSQGVGSGSGAIGSDAANNVSVGTSTTKAETKFLVIASSTDTTNYAIKILDSGQGSLLIVRNDGSVGVATSGLTYTLNVGGNIYASGNVTCGGSCGVGNVAAANITAGGFNFAQSTTTGDFAFPASLGIGTSTTVSLPAGFTAYQTSTFFGNVVVSYSTASRCLRLDANKNIVAATGDCAAGSSSGTVTTSTVVTASYFPFWNSSNGSGLNGTSSIYQSGLNIGIGTLQPSSTLHVIGGATISANVTTTNLTITGVTSQNCLGTNSAGVVQAGTCTGTGSSGTVTTSTVVTASYFPFWNSSNGSGLNGTSSIYQSGLNIGIGTLQPSSTLHIVGGSIIINGTNGGLAVGTTTVQSVGNIYATGNITSAGIFSGNIAATNVTAGTFAGASNFSFPSGLGVATSGTALPVAGLNVYATSSFLLGNVGIGTSTPAYKLTVDGNIVNTNPSNGWIGLTGDLPGNPNSTYPTLKTNYQNLYFSAGGTYTAYLASNGALTLNGTTYSVSLNPNGSSYFDGGSSRLGIGTSSPASALHVIGGATISANVTTTNLTITGVTSQNCLGTNSAGVVQAGTCTGTGSSGTVTTSTVVTASYFPFWNSSNGSGLNGTSSIYQSGLMIGIGTTTPSSSLYVFGSSGVTNTFTVDTTPLGSTGGTIILGNNGSGGDTIRLGVNGRISSNNSLFRHLAEPGVPMTFETEPSGNYAERVRIDTSGNVGIGTKQPSSTLHVVGGGTFTTNVTSTNLTITGLAGTSGCLSVNSTGYVVTSTCSGAGNVPAANITSGGFNFAQSTTTGDFAFPANLGIGTSTTASLPAGFTAYQTSTFFGNIGIGTSNPLYILDINPGNFSGIRVAFSMHNNQAAAADVGSKFRIAGVNDTTQAEFIGAWEGGNSNNSYIVFKNRENGATTEQLRITSAGNVGIGTAQPSSTLDVNGSSTFRNHINTTGTVPTVSAAAGVTCGAGTTIVGTDVAGRIVTGGPTASTAACRITFANAYPNVPYCFLQLASSSVGAAFGMKASTTASMLDISFSAVSNTSTIINYYCIGGL